MEPEFKNDIFENDISIEEFDHITDGVEDHVFSDEYQSRKETIMYNARHKAFISKLGVKAAAAASVIAIAAPFAVNAATGGELFNRIWGNAGKDTIESHSEVFVEDGKVRDDGTPVTYEVTMPGIEYVEADPEAAARLIGDKITTEPVVCTVGDTTVTVESVVRDGIGIVAAYTIERAGGVNCLNYSQLDNESKGAWFNEDSNILFGFEEGTGKIWVDLENSTDDKLCCYEYMCDNSVLFPASGCAPITDHITLMTWEYTVNRSEMYVEMPEKGDYDQFVRTHNEYEIPVAGKLDTKMFSSGSYGSAEISPIAMVWDSTGGTGIKGETLRSETSLKITYKDGSEYLVFDEDTNSTGYVCGTDTGFIVLFNRLVDIDNIAEITIDGEVFTAG